MPIVMSRSIPSFQALWCHLFPSSMESYQPNSMPSVMLRSMPSSETRSRLYLILLFFPYLTPFSMSSSQPISLTCLMPGSTFSLVPSYMPFLIPRSVSSSEPRFLPYLTLRSMSFLMPIFMPSQPSSLRSLIIFSVP
jgi:hypothetical protein